MEQRENPKKTIAISNCVKQVEIAKVRGYGPQKLEGYLGPL